MEQYSKITKQRVLTNRFVVSRVDCKDMAFVRVQKRGTRHYYYLVKSEREGNRVRQKVLQYLGTSKPSKADINTIIDRIRAKGVKDHDR